MKKLILTTITFFSLLTVFGQNGLKGGKYFLLLNDKKEISLNSFENNKVNELKKFSINEKSIYTTDQKTRVAILDTAKNDVSLFDIQTSDKTKLAIPFDLKSQTILLTDENLFIGGELGKEMLVQYHIGVSVSKIKYKSYENENIVALTMIPNTTNIILTIEDGKTKIRHEIIEI